MSGSQPAVAIGAEFLEGLATIDGPTLLVDPGALVDGQPAAVIGTADDPLSQIPPEILGAAITTQTFPVAAAFEGINPTTRKRPRWPRASETRSRALAASSERRSSPDRRWPMTAASRSWD